MESNNAADVGSMVFVVAGPRDGAPLKVGTGRST